MTESNTFTENKRENLLNNTTLDLSDCLCFQVINPKFTHQCNLCKRAFTACLSNNDLQNKVIHQAIEIDRLKSELKSCELNARQQELDIQMLNIKCIAGIEREADMQRRKELTDREIEELSVRLFEEANNMVASEKRKKHQLEKLLQQTEDQLNTEQSQLRELKCRMEAMVELQLQNSPCSLSVQSLDDDDSFNCTLGNILPPFDSKTDRNDSTFFLNRLTQQVNDLPVVQAQPYETPVYNHQYLGKSAAQNCHSSINKHTDGIKKQSSTIPFQKKHYTSVGYILKKKVLADMSGSMQMQSFQEFVEGRSKRDTSKQNTKFGFDGPSLSSSASSSLSLPFEEKDEGYIDDISYIDYQACHQSEFIAQCEVEDIEPCLRFGNPRMCTKTMMEYMSQNTCSIECISKEEAKTISSPPNSSSLAYHLPLWERWTAAQYNTAKGNNESSINTVSYLECTACGRKKRTTNSRTTSTNKKGMDEYYRFRLNESDGWLLIDRSCRNRLVTVCNYYSFIRNIQLGHRNNRSIEELYYENIQLRLAMFYSRLGIEAE